jgi:hypothetical protein
MFVLVGLGGCGVRGTDGTAGASAEPEPVVSPSLASPGAVSPADRGRFVVHEWGTFTSMQGIDGLAVDGLQHESDALPSFVHAATSPPTPSPYRLWGDASLDVPVRHASSKMETPVVYFYSDTPRRVTLRVDFEGGLLSEWFPRASIAPEPMRGAVDIGGVHRSTLGWDVALTPFTAGPPKAMPEVATSDPWAFARDVGAAYVTAKAEGEAPAEVEHYLFYRGLARLKLPLAVQPLGDAGAVVVNRGKTPVDGVFLLEVGEKEARFSGWDRAVAADSSAALLQRGEMRPKEDVVRDLCRDVAATLVAHGLYADEARAMVRTWSSTWFKTEGTRVLYVVPRQAVDETLRMTISPAPDRLERVIVARQEFMTPRATAEIETALRERTAPATQAHGMQRLARLGRFLEPVARILAAKGSDPAVRRSAAEIVAGFAHP